MVEKVIKTLNEAFENDPAAIHSLMCNRVPCNNELVNHPTIQVEKLPVLEGESYAVGALGLLNGVIEPLTGKRIAVKWSSEVNDWGQAKMLGFCEYTG